MPSKDVPNFVEQIVCFVTKFKNLKSSKGSRMTCNFIILTSYKIYSCVVMNMTVQRFDVIDGKFCVILPELVLSCCSVVLVLRE